MRSNFLDKFKFIILGSDKKPKHSLDVSYSKNEVSTQVNLGVLIEKPYVVIDIDSYEQYRRVKELIEAENIQCNIMKTNEVVMFGLALNNQ